MAVVGRVLRRNPLRRMQRRELTVAGVRVRVHELWKLRGTDADAADLTTFVLVHGLGVSSRYFVPLAERLAVHGRVILFDLPGFGGLPQPEQPLSIAGFAEVVAQTLELLHVSQPIIIGHSFGAQVAVETVAGHPGLSEWTMLVGPVVNVRERRLSTLARRFLQSSRHERISSAMVAVRIYLATNPSWPAGLILTMLAYPMEERIAEIRGQLVIVRGELDRTCPSSWVRTLAEAATGARVRTTVVPGAAHQVVIDDADRLVQEALLLAGIGTGGEWE